MSNRKIKKNQHYVPQSYLRRFTALGEKSLLWAFDKEKHEFKTLQSSVNKICSEDYYYYQIDESGDIDHIKLEDELSSIERIGNNIINRIIDMRCMPYVPILEREKGELAFYISLMLFRGPSFRDAINDVYGQVVKHALPIVMNDKNAPEIPSILKEMIETKGISNVIDINVNSVISLQPMIECAQTMGLSLLKKRWILVSAPEDNNFITSDIPVVFYPVNSSKTNGGPAHSTTEILFPLSSKVALIITPSQQFNEGIEIGNSNKDLAIKINKLIFFAANSLVFCAEKYNWLNNLPKSKGKGQRLNSGVPRDGFNIIDNPWKK
ncbi:DUF4238 domain-containing protein [Aliivibrio fischeri]|uniref:DUF4238 domain-containing protein n=1 Tax=Aliivibrio fischeri TaxID=668 RepID=UPI00080DC43E|nr:DUF4238 domain-containing protein [Aliivibrio fischeri]OCH37808.1 hypothetical protein A6E02_18325 [Aliivibrio fischeri]